MKSRSPMHITGRRARVTRDAGTYYGTLAGWRVRKRLHRTSEISERSTIQNRAEDLYINDWAARSVIDVLCTNTIGQGLMPLVRLPWRRLGISQEQARELGSEMEWLWEEWCSNCSPKNNSFADLQRQGFRAILRDGEMLHVPVMQKDNANRFALQIQEISTTRLSTPLDLSNNTSIHDGIEISTTGKPLAYWIATPASSLEVIDLLALPSTSFTRIPAHIAHRIGCFHLFLQEDEEQFRGVSVLSVAMKLFRHLSDSITYELFGQVTSASMPLVVETDDGTVALPEYVRESIEDDEKIYHQTVEAGTLLYLNKNERLKPVENARPSPNFQSFCVLVLRALSASVGLPYEAVMKDFSKTNYSSARAALLEAWRVYLYYRSWFARSYCQPIFEMVMEEAWLRGYLTFPSQAPDFYTARNLWMNTTWMGPARGYVDPTKEVQANIKANAAGLKTRREILAEQGLDFDDVMDELDDEARRIATHKNNIFQASTTSDTTAQPSNSG